MNGNVHRPPAPRDVADATRRARLAYACAALATIVLGLAVHRRLVPLPATARDVLGDALWAVMVYWGTGVLRPRATPAARACAALAIAWAVEFSQCYHTPALDALRADGLGHLVLGSDFDPRDLAAYAAGVACAALAELAQRGYVRRR